MNTLISISQIRFIETFCVEMNVDNMDWARLRAHATTIAIMDV
jgi:hypothetical protein